MGGSVLWSCTRGGGLHCWVVTFGSWNLIISVTPSTEGPREGPIVGDADAVGVLVVGLIDAVVGFPVGSWVAGEVVGMAVRAWIGTVVVGIRVGASVDCTRAAKSASAANRRCIAIMWPLAGGRAKTVRGKD